MIPPPDSSTLANNPNFATLYAHLTTHVLTPEGSTLANVSDHNSTSLQLNEARAAAIQDELLLCALEEIVSAQTNSSHEDNATKPSQLPRRPEKSSSQPSQPAPATKSNSKLNLPPDLRELILNMISYLSTSLRSDAVHQLPSDTEDLLTDDLTAFQAALPTIGPLLSTHIINTERTLSALLAPIPTPSNPNPTVIPATPTRPFRRKPPSQPPLSTLLKDLSTTTTHLQRTTLPSTLTTSLSTLHTHLQTHQTQTLTKIRNLELQTHGTHSRHLLSRSTYLTTVTRGISLKTRLLSLERERAIYSDEESIEKMEGELERLLGEERRLQGREEELVGLLGEYEGEGAKVNGGDGKGSGEQVFRVLGGRYREVEGETEVVKRDIERLETRVWRGR